MGKWEAKVFSCKEENWASQGAGETGEGALFEF